MVISGRFLKSSSLSSEEGRERQVRQTGDESNLACTTFSLRQPLSQPEPVARIKDKRERRSKMKCLAFRRLLSSAK